MRYPPLPENPAELVNESELREQIAEEIEGLIPTSVSDHGAAYKLAAKIARGEKSGTEN